MTIQAALERAKKLQQARKAADQTPADSVTGIRMPLSARDTVPVSDVATPPEVRQQSGLEPIQPVSLPYDPASCMEHRLLVPESLVDKRTATAATAYRMIRTRVLQRFRSAGWTTFGISSPGAGEGKTVTAINLAISIARERNNQVFLLDLDMRNPRVCSYLGVTPPGDLVRYFSEGTSLDRMFFQIGIEHLAIAGCASTTEHASELLASHRLEELLTYIHRRSANPVIIIDLPPVLSTDDALVIAPRIDSTFLVVGVGRTKRDMLTRAVEVLREHSVAGIIVNRSDQIVEDYYSK